MFLMHRVELKEGEGFKLDDVARDILGVPNAPCGVERMLSLLRVDTSLEFLMHRVELKGMSRFSYSVMGNVPNAPCGVESICSVSG